MPDIIRPVDRLVIVAESVMAYAQELQRLVAQLKEEGESGDRPA